MVQVQRRLKHRLQDEQCSLDGEGSKHSRDAKCYSCTCKPRWAGKFFPTCCSRFACRGSIAMGSRPSLPSNESAGRTLLSLVCCYLYLLKCWAHPMHWADCTSHCSHPTVAAFRQSANTCQYCTTKPMELRTSTSEGLEVRALIQRLPAPSTSEELLQVTYAIANPPGHVSDPQAVVALALAPVQSRPSQGLLARRI